MKHFLLLALIVSSPQIVANGQDQLVLQVDQTGHTWIVSTGVSPVPFIGYSVQDSSDPGRLIPLNWRSIDSVNDSGHPEFQDAFALLGSAFTAFSADVDVSPQKLTENSSGNSLVTLEPGDRWDLGIIFPPGLELGTAPANFLFTPATGVDGGNGLIQVVPEPSAPMLGAAGLLALVVGGIRRRARFDTAAQA